MRGRFGGAGKIGSVDRKSGVGCRSVHPLRQAQDRLRYLRANDQRWSWGGMFPFVVRYRTTNGRDVFGWSFAGLR